MDAIALGTEPTIRRGAIQRRPPPKEEQIPGYQCIEKLGEGGMASVWLAHRFGRRAPCVLKLPRTDVLDCVLRRRRFVREAQVTSMLRHPAIARTYDAGMVDPLYIAMEHVDGFDLSKLAGRWSRRQIPIAWAVAITLKALEALIYAHEFVGPDGRHMAIVHRDLGPRNIMMNFDGEVKLIDFGLVRTSDGRLTEPGTIIGTARYMAPEQVLGLTIDGRTDLYSVGAVLYELLTGRPAAEGRAVRDVLHRVVAEDPAAPSVLNAQVSSALDHVVMTALEKEPEDRYATARCFRRALLAAFPPGDVASTKVMAEAVRELFADEYMQARKWSAPAPDFEAASDAESADLSASEAETAPGFMVPSTSDVPMLLPAIQPRNPILTARRLPRMLGQSSEGDRGAKTQQAIGTPTGGKLRIERTRA